MTYRLRNIGLAIALAAVAVLLVFYYVAQERGRLQNEQELVPVWVATKNIPAGTSGAELETGGFIKEKEVWPLPPPPPADAADSPESAENYQTLLADGLKAQQVARLYSALQRRAR